jgi:hypothetical protein
MGKQVGKVSVLSGTFLFDMRNDKVPDTPGSKHKVQQKLHLFFLHFAKRDFSLLS